MTAADRGVRLGAGGDAGHAAEPAMVDDVQIVDLGLERFPEPAS
jgi:hypothetical protein